MDVVRCGGLVRGASECWIRMEVLEAGKTRDLVPVLVASPLPIF